MDRDDWIGLTVSVALHALVLFGLSVVTVAAVEEPAMGFVEVDFGSFSEGRPVSRAATRQPVTPQPEIEEPSEEEAPVAPPDVAKPVELPELVAIPEDLETIQETETEVISPASEPEVELEEEAPEPAPAPAIRPLGSGDPDGATNPEQGEDGTGAEETRRAPFQIEGLNRQAVQTILPRYTEQVNAIISVRITVGPSGRIIRRIPLIKGNPGLEQAVMQALANWRFNPLPANAPQENQTGTITFRFQLR
jgi:periplasmic protein TonB